MKVVIGFWPLYTARLQKSLTRVMGCISTYTHGMCEKYLIKLTTLCFQKLVAKNKIFHALNMPLSKYLGVSTFQK